MPRVVRSGRWPAYPIPRVKKFLSLGPRGAPSVTNFEEIFRKSQSANTDSYDCIHFPEPIAARLLYRFQTPLEANRDPGKWMPPFESAWSDWLTLKISSSLVTGNDRTLVWHLEIIRSGGGVTRLNTSRHLKIFRLKERAYIHTAFFLYKSWKKLDIISFHFKKYSC